jgi:hypothetical protein
MNEDQYIHLSTNLIHVIHSCWKHLQCIFPHATDGFIT